MWSEYLRTMDFSFSPRNSSSPSRRCRVTSVPRPAFSTTSTVPIALRRQFPFHGLIGPAGPPAETTVTLSATMKEE